MGDTNKRMLHSYEVLVKFLFGKTPTEDYKEGACEKLTGPFLRMSQTVILQCAFLLITATHICPFP